MADRKTGGGVLEQKFEALNKEHEELLQTVQYRKGAKSRISTWGGYAIALKKSRAAGVSAQTAVSSIAGDEHQGAVQNLKALRCHQNTSDQHAFQSL